MAQHSDQPGQSVWGPVLAPCPQEVPGALVLDAHLLSSLPLGPWQPLCRRKRRNRVSREKRAQAGEVPGPPRPTPAGPPGPCPHTQPGATHLAGGGPMRQAEFLVLEELGWESPVGKGPAPRLGDTTLREQTLPQPGPARPAQSVSRVPVPLASTSPAPAPAGTLPAQSSALLPAPRPSPPRARQAQPQLSAPRTALRATEGESVHIRHLPTPAVCWAVRMGRGLTVGPTAPGSPRSPPAPLAPAMPWKPCQDAEVGAQGQTHEPGPSTLQPWVSGSPLCWTKSRPWFVPSQLPPQAVPPGPLPRKVLQSGVGCPQPSGVWQRTEEPGATARSARNPSICLPCGIWVHTRCSPPTCPVGGRAPLARVAAAVLQGTGHSCAHRAWGSASPQEHSLPGHLVGVAERSAVGGWGVRGCLPWGPGVRVSQRHPPGLSFPEDGGRADRGGVRTPTRPSLSRTHREGCVPVPCSESR